MKGRRVEGLFFAVASLVASVASGFTRPLLGISFGFTAAAALALNGLRGTFASIRIRPVDADDPVSPAAIARTVEKMIRGHIIFTCIMSIAYAVVAICADERGIKIFAASFSLATAAAGPLTSIRRRPALWAATCAVTVGLLVWGLQRARV